MRKAAAFVVSAVTVLFLGSGLVVGCGSDDDGGGGGGGGGDKDAGADAGNSMNGGAGGEGSNSHPDGSASDDDATVPSSGASPFGGFCDSDADCDDGLTCLTDQGSDWFNGGPAGGFCTLPCADNPRVCQNYPNSMCVGGASDTEAYCFERCQRGSGSLFGGDKCHNRANSACFQVADNTSACLPTCGFDGECPEGRFCDLSAGVCVDVPPEGLPLGSECDPTAAQNPCAGICVELADGYAVCSGFCTFGAPGNCGVAPDAENIPPGSGMCLPLFDLQNDDIGDTGLCVQRCNCNDDCSHSAGSCSAFDDPDVEASLQAKGLCVPEDPSTPGLVCGDGGTVDSGAPADAATGGPDAAGGG